MTAANDIRKFAEQAIRDHLRGAWPHQDAVFMEQVAAEAASAVTAVVGQLKAERDAFRDSALHYAAQTSDLTNQLRSVRATCDAYKDQPPPIFRGPNLSERGEGYNAGTRDMARAILAILAGETAEEAEAAR